LKHLILVNPISGRGFAARSIPQMEGLMRAHGLDFEILPTHAPWEAAQIAENAARRGVDVVAVASGDGTLNEAVNGMMRARQAGFTHTALAALPVGTGNDAAYGLGFAGGLEEAIAALARNERHLVDIGRVTGGDFPEGRYFVNGVGVGFDAAVGFAAAKIRWTRGMPAYLIAALQTIFLYYKPPLVEMELNGEKITRPALMVSIMNGRRLGGGFYTAPNGNVSDGQLDICIASVNGRARIFTLLPHFMKGTQESQPEIQMVRTQAIHLKAVKGSLPAHSDGETLCTAGTELTVELFPRALEFVRGG